MKTASSAVKKTLKIAGITLASLLGVVIIAVVIASSIILSPKKLTSIVNKYAPQFVTCDISLGRADLTLFKTFPNVGIEIDDVTLVNPMEGAPSDTLADIEKLIVSANIRKLLKDKDIVVNKCTLENAYVNLFSNGEGKTNYDVFVTDSIDNDTTSTPFDYAIDLKEVKMKNTTVLYTDSVSKMCARLDGLGLDLKGNLKDKDIDANLDLTAERLNLAMPGLLANTTKVDISYDGTVNGYSKINGLLKLDTPDISLNLGQDYLKDDTLSLELPVIFSLDSMNGHLDNAKIGLNDYTIALNGDGSYADNGDINLDMNFSTNKLVVEDVLTYLPQSVIKAFGGIGFFGNLQLEDGTIKGVFNDSLMPLISAKVVADNAKVDIPSLPYPFTDIAFDALLDLNLNDKSNVSISNLDAMMNKTKIMAKGNVGDLTDKLDFDLDVDADMPLSDLKKFLPDNIALKGNSDVKLKVNCNLDELLETVTKYKFDRTLAQGTVVIRNFVFDMADTIHAESPKLNIGLALPSSVKTKGTKGAFISLNSSDLNARVGKDINAVLQGVDIDAIADNVSSGMNGIALNANMAFKTLKANYDTISLNADNPAITLTTTPQKSKNLKVRATYHGGEFLATMGDTYKISAISLGLDASANQNKSKTDFLNQWNPVADFSLKNAIVQVAGIDEKIIIPNIDFVFDSYEFGIKKSTVKIGQSDMSLEGNIVGIKDWVANNDNLMKGELQLSSKFLNINEIMDLTSGLGGSPNDSTATAKEDSPKEDNPFMVPRGVDFNFGVKADNAIYDNFDLHNLGGHMTVKDGTLILKEIGFTNKAAEMQLTAMYQSPRKNHLFLGMDFHLLNVQINDLLSMIPEIDTLVPMLKTFDGNAEFHITAQTNLKSNYQPKISTLRAAADIEGQNLYVKDTTSLSKITNMLMVSRGGEYKIDSLDVQLTVFRNEVDLYPFLLTMGKYKAVASGRYNLDNTCNYHISVTDTPLPTRLGLDITGTMKDLHYTLAPCKYKNLYRPEKRSDTDKMVLELKNKIAQSLKATVQ